jgi:hypothetical protein
MPVVMSTDQPDSCSTLSKWTRTVPATGLVIVRTSTTLPDGWRFTSWNCICASSPVPMSWPEAW